MNSTFLSSTALFSIRLGDVPFLHCQWGTPSSSIKHSRPPAGGKTTRDKKPVPRRKDFISGLETDPTGIFISRVKCPREAFHLLVFLENMVTSAHALLPAILLVIQSRAYDQAAITLKSSLTE